MPTLPLRNRKPGAALAAEAGEYQPEDLAGRALAGGAGAGSGADQGGLYIITAPSGAGKTSLVEALVTGEPGLAVSVSHTTRPRRQAEQVGVNYYFVSEAEFQAMARQGDFLEQAEVYGNHYGTSRRWVDARLAAGIGVILEVDWQGAVQIRELYPDSCSIFILPPTVATLRQRLQQRAQDDARIIDQRMQQAASEIAHAGEADYLVVNDDFETALADIRAIVRAHRLSTKTRQQLPGRLLAEL